MLKSNSFFLFGPRGVGKSRLLKEILDEKKTYYIDLLDEETYERFILDISLLKKIVGKLPQEIEWIAIDEIQRIPRILDSVHSIIETTDKFKFALTGSSARKLKRDGANLLAGRAFTYNLYPFTSIELEQSFDLNKALNWGTLPKSYLSEDDETRRLFLRSYVQTYLKEEIQIEQLVRRLEPFRKFLQVAAQSNGKIINFSNIARDVGVTDKTVFSYFEILEDTLIGSFLEPYNKSVRKRQRESPKFYFFDCGVTRALANQLTIPIVPLTYTYGLFFEHFVITEIKRICDYARNDYSFYYLRTKDDAEIDLIIEKPTGEVFLIETKSTDKIRDEDVKTLNNFFNDFKNATALCLSLDPIEQKIEDTICLPWNKGIDMIMGNG